MSRGYFFSIDAFIAMSVLIIGIYVLFYSSSSTLPVEVNKNLAEDVMATMASTKIVQLNDQYYPQLRALKERGLVPDIRMTLLQEAGLLYWIGNVDEATIFLDETITPAVPAQYYFAIIINDEEILARKSLPAADASSLVVSRRLLYGMKNKTSFWGPVPAEVQLWQ